MGETSGNGAEIQNVFQGLTEAQQKAKMRERVLRFWLAAVGNPVVLKMQENTTVTGILCGIDSNQEYLQMSQLSTPLYVYPETVIRVDDVLSLEVLPNTSDKRG